MIFMMQTYGKIELGKNIFHCLGWQQCLTENTYQQKSVEKYSKASYFWSKSGPQLMCFESQISTIWWISVHWCKRCFNSLGNFAYVIKHLVLREMFQDFFIFRESFTIPQIRLQVIAPPPSSSSAPNYSVIYLNGQSRPLFCLFLYKILTENCRLQRDSNLHHQSKRQARWPQDRHHDLTNHFDQYSYQHNQ